VRQALILGAVNAVGCRLAEALCDRNLAAVALVDDWAQAGRLARLPVRMIEGPVADREALGRAMADCEATFHCAEYDRPSDGAPAGGLRGAAESASSRRGRRVGSALAFRRRNLDYAEAVLNAAMQSGMGRVICVNAATVSTASERAALRYHREHGLSVTVLRPATLYGPFCAWTIDAVHALRRGRRPPAGRQPCLYVDHLVEAMLLAAGTDSGAGEVFPLHDPEPATCEALLDAHACALVGRWPPAAATRTADPSECAADANIRRARRVLGYNPRSGFAQNMERTAGWIQWSRL
jgi:nucleoside-diphosphate-sugar epimerase